MGPMRFSELVRKNRSYRGFERSRSVSKEELLQMADCARLSASSVKPEHLAPQRIVAIGKPAEQVVIREIEEGQPTAYYRDEEDVHYVPKRKQEDVVLLP